MTLAFVTIFITIVLVIVKFTIPHTKIKKYSKVVNDIYNTSLPVIAILFSFYTLWIGEQQGDKRPLLRLEYDCELDSVEEMNGMYYYDIFLTNQGDIDAQVTLLEINYVPYLDGGRDYTTTLFTIPTQTSKRILRKRGEKIDTPNFLLANYSISYTAINGNGDLMEGDTIFCKK
ncbi:MAG: hypothetical protein IPG78_03650 [Ignavibacteria bacterium]|nr:hypothetical protein [Ignavibacteria bacterium]